MLTTIFQPEGQQLVWMEPVGIGFFDCDAHNAALGAGHVYDDDYFANYQGLAESPIAKALNDYRAGMVTRHAPVGGVHGQSQCSLLDVGIGDGAFLRRVDEFKAWLEPFGCDVNPAGVAWLVERGQLSGFEEPASFDMVTFWDSLEHIRDPRPALAAARHVAIVSLPVFTSAEHAIASKHFKPREHFWYFTRHGFCQFADREGFDVVDVLATESALGREEIETFVLKRRP